MGRKTEVQEWFESGRDRVVPREARVPPTVVPDWLAHAVRFCRDGTDALAERFTVVPGDRVDASPFGVSVRCVCEATVPLSVPREFVECVGGCGRWFVRDDETVWAARVPEALGGRG